MSEPLIRVPGYRHPTRTEHADFFTTRVVLAEGTRVEIRKLYSSYRQWCQQHRLQPVGVVTFGRLIEAPRLKSGGKVYILGITLL